MVDHNSMQSGFESKSIEPSYRDNINNLLKKCIKEG